MRIFENARLKVCCWRLIARMYMVIIRRALSSSSAVMRYALGDGGLRDEIARRIDTMVLSERDRAILKRRLLDGIKIEPLAEEFELSERTIRTICNRYRCLF